MAPKTTSKKSPKKAPVKKVAVKKVTSKKAPVKKVTSKKAIPKALRQWHAELNTYIKNHPDVSRKVAMMKASELRQKKGVVKKSVNKSAPKFCKPGKVMIVDKCYKYCPEGKIRNPNTRKCGSVKRVRYTKSPYKGKMELPEIRFSMSPRKGSMQLPE